MILTTQPGYVPQYGNFGANIFETILGAIGGAASGVLDVVTGKQTPTTTPINPATGMPYGAINPATGLPYGVTPPPAEDKLPSWVLPAAIGGGVLVLALVLVKK